MNTGRRDFLKGTAWMGAAAVMAGCQCERLGFGSGGSMQGFAMKPMKKLRVGVIGIGSRGTGAVHRLAMIPGLEVAAVCDRKQHRVDGVLKWLAEKKFPRPQTFVGDEAWKDLCDWDGVNVVYIDTPWALHARMALRALRNGKPAFVEVPSALTLDECWELVETSEAMRTPCMILENCCYGEMEMLCLNLVRSGLLGDIVHGEGAYIHDLRFHSCVDGRDGENEWRYYENRAHKGNRYPTHGLVPIMQVMDINRGDRFDYLVSLESDQANCEAFIRENLPAYHPRRRDKIEMGDMNTTLIKTVRGRSIMVQHDVSSPRPYSRLNLVTGTKGVFWGMPWRNPSGPTFKLAWEDKSGDMKAHTFFPPERAAEIRERFRHPLWKQAGEVAKKVGGHGGIDFIMDLRWAYCLQNGIPLDMDVYDLATSSCLCELTERSVRARSASVDVPDFTRGGWKTARPLGIVDFDMSKIDFGRTMKDDAALSV